MGRIPTHCELKLLPYVHSGFYRIDDQGRIWKKHRQGEVRAESNTGNYLQIRKMVDGVRVHALAHRLVYVYFKGPVPGNDEVNHDNGIKADNRPNNLIAESCSGNMRHANKNGLRDQHGQINPAAKLTDNEVAQIRLAYSKGGYTMHQLADMFGVRFQHISRLVKGQRRPKQGGPLSSGDLRHIACERDPENGQFIPPQLPEVRA